MSKVRNPVCDLCEHVEGAHDDWLEVFSRITLKIMFC